MPCLFSVPPKALVASSQSSSVIDSQAITNRQLWDRQACFYYNFESLPCVDQELLEEVKYGVAYSRCIKVSIRSLNDIIDVKVDGITKRVRSISNCPYRVNDIIEDQGLHCFLGTKITNGDIEGHCDLYLEGVARF